MHVLVTTKELEIYWGDVLLRGLAVYSRPYLHSAFSTAGVRCLLHFPPSSPTWIIQLWLPEICCGQAPAAPLNYHRLRLMLYLHPAQFQPTEKCRSRGLEQVRAVDIFPLLSKISGILVRNLFCFLCAGVGWWVGAFCHPLVRGVSLGPWTSGPAHVYWTKLGCSLGKVRLSYKQLICGVMPHVVLISYKILVRAKSFWLVFAL